METIIANPQDTGSEMTNKHWFDGDETNPQLLEALRMLLTAIGEDPDREGLQETPTRILRMWKEIFRGYNPERKPAITTFRNTKHIDELVFDTGDYYSMCEHHVLPFFGQYYFAYLPDPDGRILGISKVARVVSYCAARLQLQERLAHQIVDMLTEALQGRVRGMAILLRGRHMCKTMRGVRNRGEMCVTCYTGAFQRDRQLRNEFLRLVDLQR